MGKKEKKPLPEPNQVEERPAERFPLACYANRELSWLQFNGRVLEEALDDRNPLCERLSFAAIFQSNLDEFFMVRVGALHDQMPMNIRENKTGMTAQEQMGAVLAQVREDLKKKDAVYAGLMEQLRPYGAQVLSFEQLTEAEQHSLEAYFIQEVQPLLSPQIVGPKQPFPFLNSREIYAIITLRTKNSNERLGIIPCSNHVLRRLAPIAPGSHRYILVEDLILHFAPRIFERYRIVGRSLVRILRNADIDVDDAPNYSDYDQDDFRRKMEKLIRTRRKLCPIKLEYRQSMDEQAVSTLCKYLGLSKKQVFPSEAPLDLGFLFQLQDDLRERKELFYPRRLPQPSPMVNQRRSMLRQVQEKDILLAYPYESMQPFLRLLQEAGHDPDVASIKMTLYRVAKNSRVVDALCQAAENGKEVVVMVELRARFDEEHNIEWSRVLEEAGCRIIYGLDGLKIHSKLCLITRRSEGRVSYISQIGTGNYNEKTSKQYTDLSLMTADQNIGREVATVFNALCMGQVVDNMEHLMVAPHCLQGRLCQLIDGEIAKAQAGESAYIGIKCNSLTDKVLIDKLMEASQAGVKIEMVIRGICCMVSGLPGYTDNIRVVSIVGRYLEHARIYLFGTGEEEKVYIASADFMTRNTLHRVEVAAPIYDPDLRKRIRKMFRTMMDDNVKARVQQSDGTYLRRSPAEGEALLNAQEAFFEEAYRAAGNQLPEHRGGAVSEVIPEEGQVYPSIEELYEHLSAPSSPLPPFMKLDSEPEPQPEPEPVYEASAPEPEPVHEEPAPEPEPVHEEPAPEPEPVHEEPAPEPEPVHEEPAPEPEPVHEEPAPKPRPVHEEPAPKPEPVHEVPAPKPEPVHEEPKPKPEPVHEEPAPKPEPVHEEPAPKPEPVHEVPIPKPEQPPHKSSLLGRFTGLFRGR